MRQLFRRQAEMDLSAKLGLSAAVGSWLVAAAASGPLTVQGEGSSRGSAFAAQQVPEVTVYKSPT